MEWVILFLQCVALYILVLIAARLETRHSAPSNEKQRWAVHVVRDTDANHTLSVVLRHTGALIEWDSEPHNAIMQASEQNNTQNLLVGGSLRSPDGVEVEFVRVVHNSVNTEHMQQVLETHLCDIVPIDTDGPDPLVILDDMHALLGVLLSRYNVIPLQSPACHRTHPSTPIHSPRRRHTTVAKPVEDSVA